MKAIVSKTLHPSGTSVRIRRNRKMKFVSLTNYVDGIEQIGFRATGVYMGHPIERTIWIPSDNVNLLNVEDIMSAVKADYDMETKIIDRL